MPISKRDLLLIAQAGGGLVFSPDPRVFSPRDLQILAQEAAKKGARMTLVDPPQSGRDLQRIAEDAPGTVTFWFASGLGSREGGGVDNEPYPEPENATS